MTNTTITKFVSDVASLAVKAGKLGETLQNMMQAAPDQKAFKVELYAAAKGKSELAYASVRQLYSRALKALGWATAEKRGAQSKKADSTKANGAKAEGKAGMTDALAIARVAQLCNSFLTADDAAIAARLMAALDNRLKAATGSAKKSKAGGIAGKV